MADNNLADAGKRVRDAYALHKLADPTSSIGKWFAARLDDGTTDNVLYDSKLDAIRGQKHDEKFYAFIQITPATMDERMAATFLDVRRRLYDKGINLADPDARGGGFDPIPRVTREDNYNQLRAFFRGDVAPTNLIYGRDN